VHLFDRCGLAIKRKAPSNIFKLLDLYTAVAEDGSRDLRIEHAFSAYEKNFARARNILEELEFGDEQNVADIYAFVGSMLVRTPRHIDFMQDQFRHVLKVAKSVKITPGSKPVLGLTSVGPKYTIAQFEKFTEAPMNHWFPEQVDAQIRVLVDLFGFDVLVNKSEDPFLTSDAPATVSFPPRKTGPFPRGLGWPGCEVTMPISPRQALLFRHKSPGLHAFLPADQSRVLEINFRTITRARETIVSDRADIDFVKAITDHVAKVDAGKTKT
jgi:hypothetical protein